MEKYAYQFNIGPKNVQIAVVVFSSMVYPSFDLNTYSDSASLTKAIADVEYNAGSTRTDKGLAYAFEHSFTTAAGARQGIKKILMVFTDGKSNLPELTAKQAERIHGADIAVFAIGIGRGIDHTELDTLASRPENVHNIKSFDTLTFFQKELLQSTCTGNCRSRLPNPNTTKQNYRITTMFWHFDIAGYQLLSNAEMLEVAILNTNLFDTYYFRTKQ